MILAHGTGIDDGAFVVLPFLVLAAVHLFKRRRSPDAPGLDAEGATGDDVASS